MSVLERLAALIRAKLPVCPEAYEEFLRGIEQPPPFDSEFDCLVVVSHEERDAEGRCTGMTAENAARVRKAAQLLLSVHTNDEGGPFLVLISSSEIGEAMQAIAINEGVPEDRIILLSSFSHRLRLFHTARKYFGPLWEDVELTVGDILWPPEEELEANDEAIVALMGLLDQEIEKTRRYCDVNF